MSDLRHIRNALYMWLEVARYGRKIDPSIIGLSDMIRVMDAEIARAPDLAAQCCMCGKKDLSTVEGDGGQECQLTDGRWTCSRECYEKATEPDLAAMRAGYDLAAAEAREMGVWLRRFDLAVKDKGEG